MKNCSTTFNSNPAFQACDNLGILNIDDLVDNCENDFAVILTFFYYEFDLNNQKF